MERNLASPAFQFVPVLHSDGCWQFVVLDQAGTEVHSGDGCFLTWEAAMMAAVGDLLDHILPGEPQAA